MYREVFCIPQVTTVFLSSCDSGLADSVVCHQAYLGSLLVWEHEIALHPRQGIRVSSLAEGDFSWDFSSCVRNLGYILQIQRGWSFETPLCSEKSGLLSS